MRESAQEKRVHVLRRRVKSLRALARLLEQLGARNARDINDRLGSLGRELSDERDLTVRNAWLEKNGFAELAQRAPRASKLGPLPAAVKKEEAKLRHESKLQVLSSARLQSAFTKTTKKAAAARAAAEAKGRARDFHRWRKRVRDLVEQGKLLGVPPPDALKRVVKQLGKAQDTVVVREGLRRLPGTKPARKLAKKEGRERREHALAEKVRFKPKGKPLKLQPLR